MTLSPHLKGSLHSQENRLFTLHSPVPEAGLLLDQFTGVEAVSAPFQFTLQLLSEQGKLEARELLGRALGISLRTADGGERWFHGQVTAFRHSGTDGGFARYEATLGPWTEFLKHRTNCKLFQGKNVLDILREVFGDYGHLARCEWRLKDSDYPALPLCVQYRESDFQFMSRLLEAEGIHYHFRFEADGHILVLDSDSTLAAPMPVCPRIPYNKLSGATRQDTIDAWETTAQVVATTTVTKTSDFKNPRAPLEAREITNLPAGPYPALEDYEPAGAFGFPDLRAGERLAHRRMEEHEARQETFAGASNCRFLTCGHAFELLDHYRQGTSIHDQSFFVTRVVHTGRNNHRHQAAPADYRNRFDCLRKLIPFQPARVTPRPLVHGPQTAKVVGPPNEEIYCDAYGRVRIQFPWDRKGQFSEASSCWVRVSCPLAGDRFGFIAVPRIGQEVVVEFLEGNPDRPLITGQVYNLDHMPPWPLPANRTQSGLLTRSSKGGNGDHANALRFEDAKGAEEVWLHAEKDQRLEVEHDESHEVGHDRAKTIGHDETTAVEHDRSETVGNDERVTIGANQTLAIGVDRTETVGGNEAVNISGTQSLHVGQSQSITVAAAKSETVTLVSSEHVGGARFLSVGAAYAVQVGADKNEAVGHDSFEAVAQAKRTRVGSTYRIEVEDQLEIIVGASRLVMSKDGTVTLAGKQVNIQAEGPLKLSGKDIEANG